MRQLVHTQWQCASGTFFGASKSTKECKKWKFQSCLHLSAAFVLFLFCVEATLPAMSQTYTNLHSFTSSGNDGEYPLGALVQSLDGSFYGTTSAGGANGDGGTVFKITGQGTLTTLHSFCSASNCADGIVPTAGLIQASDGNFYGTASEGGAAGGGGVVFKMTPAGAFTTLYSFCLLASCADGESPAAPLIQGTDGNFYGTTSGGGPNGGGSVFKITPLGTLNTIYGFCAQTNCPNAPLGGLLQARDGNFYGTTSVGGTNNSGVVFRITSAGALSEIYNFCTQANCTDGNRPVAALIQASEGSLYGTTQFGGKFNSGTIFRLTETGKLTTLYAFCPQNFCPDGSTPQAGLVQATDGNFYGTTSIGGAFNEGAIFRITPSGTFTTLYSLGGTDGGGPVAALIQATNGSFYGTNEDFGGDKDNGTVFTLAVGLGRFIETKPAMGKVGTRVTVLGNNLRSATAVTFNGTAATYKIVSASEIMTTVPVGATTGKVQVTVSQGTLTSNVAFRVKP